jgi:hypothetical protein
MDTIDIEQIKRQSAIWREILSLIEKDNKPTLEKLCERFPDYTNQDIKLELKAWYRKKIVNFFLSRYTLIIISIIISLVSLIVSVFILKETTLNLFASSGAIMSGVGLFLTIKHNLVVTWLIPLDWASNIMKYGYGASLGNENTEQDYKNTINIKRDEQTGIILIIIGNIVWAYSSYIPPQIFQFLFNF